MASAHQPELIATALVLEEGDRNRKHAPQLCLGGAADSLPPQCGGPDIPNWDWSAVQGEDRHAGTRWGAFTVVGHYDPEANTFTLTRPAAPPAPSDQAGQSSDNGWHTPCAEPAGGWRVLDPARATDASLDKAVRTARQRHDYAGVWLDQSINPASQIPPEGVDMELNDPTLLILNVAVTGDTEAATIDLRQVWGGALCVSSATYTEAELRRVARELNDTPGLLGSSFGDDKVWIQVIYDAGDLQADVDSRYGPGAVQVTSALRPATASDRSPASTSPQP